MRVQVLEGLASVEQSEWDTLVGDASPFLEYGWLASLEQAGCVSAATGWLPRHLAIRDEQNRLIAACPLYVKGHSQGEFVFDHGWANAAAGAGIPYYPKLLVASPFTPATGVRFLTHPDTDRRETIRLLAQALVQICEQADCSSVHVNFCLPDEVAALASVGFVERVGYQFQWKRHDWQTFDDYLAAFRSKRRNQIRRERRALDTQGVTLTCYRGNEIPDDLFAPMFELYRSTVDKYYWGHRYLNAELFELLRRHWRHRLWFMIARRGEQIVAGTFNVHKGTTLYGRYWGTFTDLRYLHFNVCYYDTIDRCLQHGIQRFEPGAGGEFKQLRGFDATPTVSMHYVRNPQLADAVRRALDRERDAVRHEIEWLGEQSALKPRENEPG